MCRHCAWCWEYYPYYYYGLKTTAVMWLTVCQAYQVYYLILRTTQYEIGIVLTPFLLMKKVKLP